jgi:C4-dicarboxylate transporter DctM subunit
MPAVMSAKKWPPQTGGKRQPKEILVAGRKAAWALPAPVVILGGIYRAMFTPIVAAVASVFYSLFIALTYLPIRAGLCSPLALVQVSFRALFCLVAAASGL